MKRRSPVLTIQIPEPCSQSWDDMTPENGGRHCAACAKTVVDFTRMTDAQILEVMRKSAGGCGRFRADQLNRELIAPPARKYFSLGNFYKLAASLLLVFSAGKVAAQEKMEVHAQDKMPQEKERATTVISGVVMDERGEPLTSAIIELEGTQIRASAGVDGDFNLQVPNNLFRRDSIQLTLVYPGFDTKQVSISKKAAASALLLKMSTLSQQTSSKSIRLEDMVVIRTGAYSRPLISIADTSKPKVLSAEELEKMAVREVATQVSGVSGIYQQRGESLNIGDCRGANGYIIDNAAQVGNSANPKPKKWWQFWKRH